MPFLAPLHRATVAAGGLGEAGGCKGQLHLPFLSSYSIQLSSSGQQVVLGVVVVAEETLERRLLKGPAQPQHHATGESSSNSSASVFGCLTGIQWLRLQDQEVGDRAAAVLAILQCYCIMHSVTFVVSTIEHPSKAWGKLTQPAQAQVTCGRGFDRVAGSDLLWKCYIPRQYYACTMLAEQLSVRDEVTGGTEAPGASQKCHSRMRRERSPPLEDCIKAA
jgi:hypothetical protein